MGDYGCLEEVSWRLSFQPFKSGSLGLNSRSADCVVQPIWVSVSSSTKCG